MEFLNKWPWLKYVLTLVVGVAIGAILYPTKRIEERLETQHRAEIVKLTDLHKEERQKLVLEINKSWAAQEELKVEFNKTISSLKTQIKEFESKSHSVYSKIIRPDGTVEINRIKDSYSKEISKLTEELTEKYKMELAQTKKEHAEELEKSSLETQMLLTKKDQEYSLIIDQLKSSKITSINEKRFVLEAGLSSSTRPYGHFTAGLFGPVVVGIHLDGPTLSGADKTLFSIGGGAGLRF